jgi:hypothetical protein
VGESAIIAPAPSVREASVLAQQLGELIGNVLGLQVLPRADVLILGGDLAYPNPSNETYETRLFRQASWPSPSQVYSLHADPAAQAPGTLCI